MHLPYIRNTFKAMVMEQAIESDDAKWSGEMKGVDGGCASNQFVWYSHVLNIQGCVLVTKQFCRMQCDLGKLSSWMISKFATKATKQLLLPPVKLLLGAISMEYTHYIHSAFILVN